MIKYYCDKCDKRLDALDIFTIEIAPPEIRQWEDDAYTGQCILCRNCLKEFQRWMRKR